MALFGVQLVMTMIVASFLHKLSPYYSLGRWLLTSGLRRYLPPSDKLLRPHVVTPSQPNNKATRKKAANQREKILTSPNSTPAEILAAINFDPTALDPSLAVPKSANLKLESSPLNWGRDVEGMHYSGELEFLLNLSLASLTVYALTCAYFLLRPEAVEREYNLSVIWLAVVIAYAFKVLFSLTLVYLSEELSHQRSLIIVFTTLLFVCALIVLLVDESILDFGLEKSHQDITKCITVLLEGAVKDAKDLPVLPMWCFKLFLAIFCNVLSMVLVFPGFRFADTHFNAVYHHHARTPLFKTLLHANYIAPMFSLSLWIRPLTQDVIADRSAVNFFGALEVSYETFRVMVLISVCVLRFCLFRTYLQCYLDTAKLRAENLRQEQGKVTILQIRKRVTNVFLFYAALGVQYLAPYIILLCLTLLLSSSAPRVVAGAAVSAGQEEVGSAGNVFASSGFGLGLFQGCIAFVCWWVCLSNAVTSGFGAVLKEFI